MVRFYLASMPTNALYILQKTANKSDIFRNFNVRHRQIKRLLHLLVKNDGMNVLGSHLGNLNRSRGKMTQFQ